jgi:hypothetical protein
MYFPYTRTRTRFKPVNQSLSSREYSTNSFKRLRCVECDKTIINPILGHRLHSTLGSNLKRSIFRYR